MPVDVVSPNDVSAPELNALLRTADKPVLAYIWAPFCPPCQTMAPEIAKAAALLGEQAIVVKLSAAAESQALTSFNIAAVPSLVLFSSEGEERARTLGALPAQQVVDWVLRNSK